ncbi:MAG: MMPL family transporter [Pseudomonadota bacterium]
MADNDGRITAIIRWIRIPVILLIAVLVGLAVPQIPKIKLDFGFHSFFENSRGLPALQEYKELYGEDVNLIIVILEADDIFKARNLRAIERLSEFLGTRKEITGVTSLTDVDVIRNVKEDGEDDGELRIEPFIKDIPDDTAALDALREEASQSRQLRRFLISDNGKVTAVVGELEGHLKRQNRLIADVEKWIETEHSRHPESTVRHFMGGMNVIQLEYESKATDNMFSTAILIVVIMGFILLLQYRRITGVVLPVLCSLVSMALVVGLMVAVGQTVNVVSQLIPELMIIIGIADGIYILSRFFEEREKLPPGRALDVTMRHMIVACFFTSLTTAVGFGSLYAADMYLIKRFGVFCAVGVMISYVNVILITSAALSFSRKRPSGGAAGSSGSGKKDDLTEKILRWSVRAIAAHPRVIVAVSVILIVAASGLSLRIKTQHRLLSELDPENPTVKVNELFENNLFGVLSFAIELQGPEGSMVEPKVLKKIDGIVRGLEKDEGVRKTLSLSETLKEFNEKWMDEGPGEYKLPKSRELAVQYLDFLDPELKKKIVNEDYSKTRIMLRTKNLPSKWWVEKQEVLTPKLDSLFPPGGEITWRYNGSSHLAAETLEHLIHDLLSTMILSIVMITILMTLLFRSITIGLISMIPNLMPLSMTFGFMGAAGIELRPATAIIFAVSLGIAVNDTIHLMARFREELKKTADIREAVNATVMSAGRPVIYTSVLLIAGYSVLLTSDFVAVRHFSLLFSITLITALWADLLLTPILLIFAGKRIVKGRTDSKIDRKNSEGKP